MSRTPLNISKSKIATGFIVLWIATAMIHLFNILPYTASQIDKAQALYQAPFSDGQSGIHWLGTDMIGRDVLAGMMQGSYYAFVICIITLMISITIGLFFGLTSGYYGNQLKVNFFQIILIVLGIAGIIYLLVYGLSSAWMMFLISIALAVLIYIFGKISPRKIHFPMDTIVNNLVLVKEGIPSLIIIIAIVGIYGGNLSLIHLAIIISIFVSITYTRHIRSETRIIKNEAYILSAKSMGLSDMMIMVKYIIPNIIPQLAAIIAFSLSGIILLEATLSFLGIGVATDVVTWGKLLSQSRLKPSAWWLAVFPGIAITLLIFAFNAIGNRYAARYRRTQVD